MTRRSGPRRSARGRRARADSRRWPDTLCRATRPPHWGGLTGRKAGAAGSFPFGAWRSERVGTRRNTAAAVAWAAPAERPAPAHQSALPRARRPGQLSAAASTCVECKTRGARLRLALDAPRFRASCRAAVCPRVTPTRPACLLARFHPRMGIASRQAMRELTGAPDARVLSSARSFGPNCIIRGGKNVTLAG